MIYRFPSFTSLSRFHFIGNWIEVRTQLNECNQHGTTAIEFNMDTDMDSDISLRAIDWFAIGRIRNVSGFTR
jgi:hypothetical protein